MILYLVVHLICRFYSFCKVSWIRPMDQCLVVHLICRFFSFCKVSWIRPLNLCLVVHLTCRFFSFCKVSPLWHQACGSVSGCAFALSVASEGRNPGFKTQRRHHTKSKTGISVAPQKKYFKQECMSVGCLASTAVAVPGGCLPARGSVCLHGGICLPRGVVCLPGGACLQDPLDRMTDACKNITLP